MWTYLSWPEMGFKHWAFLECDTEHSRSVDMYCFGAI